MKNGSLEKGTALKSSLLLGGVGDAVGLPYEGIGPRRLAKLFPGDSLLSYHLFFGRGAFSDDTEHAVMTFLSLATADGNEKRFGKQLAAQLRWWVAALPAGIGFATLRSTIRLWLGFRYDKSGVFSAGNGPAMRSPVIGVWFRDDLQLMLRHVTISTEITHSDPLALDGAVAVALAAAWSSHRFRFDKVGGLHRFSDQLSELLGGDRGDALVLSLIRKAESSVANGESLKTFAQSIGCSSGVSGYMPLTVAVAIHAWLTGEDDPLESLRQIFSLGGDTDTVGFIAGAIIGAGYDYEQLPQWCLKGIVDYPLTPHAVASSVDRTLGNPRRGNLFWPYPLALIRNLLFMVVILFHGFRRLFPPY